MNRLLSPSEFNFYLHDIYIFMESRLNQRLDVKQVKSALKILQLEHPFLRTSIHPRGEKHEFYFLDDPVIDFQEVHEEPELFIQKLINQKIARGKLFKTYLLRHHEGDIFITVAQHSIADGISLKALHERFFQLVEELMDHKNPKPKESNTLPQPLKELLPKNHPALDQETFEKKIAQDPKLSYFNGDLKEHPSKTIERINLRLTASETAQLKEISQKQEVSVNAAICAFLLKAAYQKIQSQGEELTLANDITFNARPRLPNPIQDQLLSSYVAVINSKVTFGPRANAWSIAKQIHAQTQKGLEKEKLYESILFFDKIFENLTTQTLPQKVFLYTSNLGPVHFHTKKLKIRDFNFHSFCFVPFLMTFFSFNNELRFSFIFTRPYLTEKFMKSFTTHFIEQIESELKRNQSHLYTQLSNTADSLSGD